MVAHQDGYGFKAALKIPDICILDVMLPNKFSIEIAEAMRTSWVNSVPDLAGAEANV